MSQFATHRAGTIPFVLLLLEACEAHSVDFTGPAFFLSEWASPSIEPFLPPAPPAYEPIRLEAKLEGNCSLPDREQYPHATNDASMVTAFGVEVCRPLRMWDRIVSIGGRTLPGTRKVRDVNMHAGTRVEVERMVLHDAKRTHPRPNRLRDRRSGVGDTSTKHRALLVLAGQFKCFRSAHTRLQELLFAPNDAAVSWEVMALTDPFEFCNYREEGSCEPGSALSLSRYHLNVTASLLELYGDRLVYIKFGRASHNLARLANAWQYPLQTLSHRYERVVALRFDVALNAPLVLAQTCSGAAKQFFAISGATPPTPRGQYFFHNRDVDFGAVACRPSTMQAYLAGYLHGATNSSCDKKCPLNPPRPDFKGRALTCSMLRVEHSVIGCAAAAFAQHGIGFGNLDARGVFLGVLRPVDSCGSGG